MYAAIGVYIGCRDSTMQKSAYGLYCCLGYNIMITGGSKIAD